MSIYDTGILMTSGFSIGSGKPADLKFLADTIQDRDNYIINNLGYEGMLVYVKEEKKTYQYLERGWEEFGFSLTEFANNVYNGLDSDSTTLALSAKQGKVLNNRITNHIESNLHITEEDRTKWDNKVDITRLSTQTMNGLMSASDKLKLDSIDVVTGSYVHPATHPATMIVEDENHRFVTDEQIATWMAKASTSVATSTENGLMSSEDKKKLDRLDELHTNDHPASIITEDENHRFVTDEQITAWNALIDKVNYLEQKIQTAVFYA